jgi:hypothetical protein
LVTYRLLWSVMADDITCGSLLQRLQVCSYICALQNCKDVVLVTSATDDDTAVSIVVGME